MSVDPSSRLGLYYPTNSTLPVGLYFTPEFMGSLIVSNSSTGPFYRGLPYNFIGLTYPYKVAMQVCNQIGKILLDYTTTYTTQSQNCTTDTTTCATNYMIR